MIAQIFAETVSALPQTANLALPPYFDAQWLLTESKFAHAVLPLIAVIVFIETGLFFPFLPGDSLLFTAGLLATSQAEGGKFPQLWQVIAVATLTAIVGDNVSYWIGRRTGPKLFSRPKSWLLKPKYLEITKEFFEKHGIKTLLIGHFAPTVRTFIPPAAGASGMKYQRFFPFNLVGAVLWGVGLTWIGSLLGEIPFIRDNVDLVVIAVIVITLVPIVLAGLRARFSQSISSNSAPLASAEVSESRDAERSSLTTKDSVITNE